ncbi:hypothetical protein AALO_G00012380 [Alosa alosa]|uniref:Tumor necrosis factor ligand superfamily member 10 n=1 Tax=Alosa alosa TaxID=278164 RepID=A0AAV6HFU4_9TELE|nr:tumor necrosis factor ligand superfamily member 10-like [Alosa alosa]KAG5286223.1 hypothetical protein AALO_G00012380 [Alosa alosa]
MESSHSLYLGLILLGAVLLQTVAVAISFLYFNYALSTVKQAFSRSSVSCLMGTSILYDKEERKYDPCWQILQQLQYRIEKTMAFEKATFNTEFNSDVRGEWISPSTVENYVYGHRPEIAAHLTARPTFLTKEDTDIESPPSNAKVLGQKIEAWEFQRGLAFQSNLVMSDGELIFPQAGLYYIYSQTYFRLSQQESEEEYGEVLQYIYQKMSSYPVPILLMKNARTTCWSRDQDYGLYSIYQAAVVPLSTGDRVFVTVSNISTLDMDERTSFFGAFLVT